MKCNAWHQRDENQREVFECSRTPTEPSQLRQNQQVRGRRRGRARDGDRAAAPPSPPRRARNPAALSHKCGNKCGHALWPRDPYIDCWISSAICWHSTDGLAAQYLLARASSSCWAAAPHRAAPQPASRSSRTLFLRTPSHSRHCREAESSRAP